MLAALYGRGNEAVPKRRWANPLATTERAVSSNSAAGVNGEKEVVRLVPCPNCGKRLTRLPPNYPLYDVQCTGCAFRAQVKSVNCPPQDEVFGAGWDILDKVLKSGFMIPPLIVNYRWRRSSRANREIRFYPFIPKQNIRMRQLPPTARRANYKMFNYVGLRALPHHVLYHEVP